jgi:uncharacterized protein DUF4112
MTYAAYAHRAADARGRKTVDDLLGTFTEGMTHEERLAQVKWLAQLMDDNFTIPGTKLRFGWDSVIGLFPGIGDVLTSAVSLLIVHHARQTGASSFTIARMLGNVGIDFVVGAIPFVGDLFDFAFKANRKNARLLEKHLLRRAAKERGTVEIIPPGKKVRLRSRAAV